MLTLLGIPFDQKSSYLTGPALAPDRIRQALHCGAGNSWTELGQNPLDDPRFQDGGNLDCSDYFGLEKQVRKVLVTGSRCLSLGGDHSVAYPVVKAHRAQFGEFEILQIDAHGDLYDEFEGDRHSHACPFARIMEEGLCSKLTQVGVRTLTPHQRQQAERFGVEVVEMKDFARRAGQLRFSQPLYLSLDLDGLDPAFAPGVSHHEPGGLTTRQVLDLIHGIEGPIIGADIVEYNPHRDVSDMTAALAAKLLKEIAGKMLTSKS